MQLNLKREEKDSDAKLRISLAREFGMSGKVEFALPQTDNEIIMRRSEEIMSGLWAEADVWMLTRSTTSILTRRRLFNSQLMSLHNPSRIRQKIVRSNLFSKNSNYNNAIIIYCTVDELANLLLIYSFA